MTNIKFLHGAYTPLGRTFLRGDVLWGAHSGTGISFFTNADKISIYFVGDSASTRKNENITNDGVVPPDSAEASYARVGIFVNDKMVKDLSLCQENQLCTVALTECALQDTTERTGMGILHEGDFYQKVSIIKLSESAMSMMGIRDIDFSINDEKDCTPPKCIAHLGDAPKLKIEFIGDSITCGYGVDELNASGTFSTKTENVTKTYAYKCAKALNAAYSFVCFSGYGVYSGFTTQIDAPNTAQLVPPYYEKLGFSYGNFLDAKNDEPSITSTNAKSASDIAWDFARFVPDLVVINLGTNDESFTKGNSEREAIFAQKYKDFLYMVRKNNPNAKILCVLGLMGQELFSSIIMAVKQYQSECGDEQVYTKMLSKQIEENGIGIDGHPSEKSQTIGAKELCNAICNLFDVSVRDIL